MAMDSLALSELASQIIRLNNGLNAATYKWLMLVAEYEDRVSWPDGEIQSCAQWLQKKCGLKIGAARERLRVAWALKDLPKISAAMAKGALSFSKVRAISRIATRANEDQLLTITLRGTAEDAERAVQELRRGSHKNQDTKHPTGQRNVRSVTHAWKRDGSLLLTARLPAESGKLVLHALETAMTTNNGTTFIARRADALVALAEMFLNSRKQPTDARFSNHVVPVEGQRTKMPDASRFGESSVPLIEHQAPPQVAA
jgi:Domain of unknown function (DUF222)